MGTHVIKMPDIGEGIAEVELSVWHVKVGDLVVEDQVLADVMTDKAMVDIPSPVHGRVIAFGGGEISIPLEAIGAAMVLTRDHRLEILPALDEGGRRTMWIVVAVLTVLQVLPLFSPAT